MYDAFKYFERAAELVADDHRSDQAAGRVHPVGDSRRAATARPRVVQARPPRVVAWFHLLLALRRPHGGTA
jgi:hypothetical protein